MEYRKPNVARFLAELEDRKKAIEKFDKFVERALYGTTVNRYVKKI